MTDDLRDLDYWRQRAEEAEDALRHFAHYPTKWDAFSDNVRLSVSPPGSHTNTFTWKMGELRKAARLLTKRVAEDRHDR